MHLLSQIRDLFLLTCHLFEMLVLLRFWLSVSSLLHQLCSSCRNAAAFGSEHTPRINFCLRMYLSEYPFVYVCIYLSMNVSIYLSWDRDWQHTNIVNWGTPYSTLFSNSSGEGYQVSEMLLFLSWRLSPRESLNSQAVIFQIGKKIPSELTTVCCLEPTSWVP